MKIHVHVGVHKTATTFMQERLKGNLTKLNKAGIGFMPTFQFRTNYVRKLLQLDPDKFELEDHLADFFPTGMPEKTRGIIMSDENLIGLCGTMLTTGQVYAGVRGRMSHLRKLLAGHEVTLFCAVRRYDAFLASAYCEGLRTSKRYINFEDFTNRVNWKAMSWPVLLERFEKGLHPDRVYYWRYEQFRKNSEKVLQSLAFGEKLDDVVSDAGNVTYPSLSQAAVDALDSVSERLGREVASRLVRAVSASLPKSEGYADFDPWGAAEKSRLARRYDEDCGMIPPEKWLVAPLIEDFPAAGAKVA